MPMATGVKLWSNTSNTKQITDMINISLKWKDCPVGTVATAFGGGRWYKVENGWKWNGPDGTGSTFPTPGADVQEVILPKVVLFTKDKILQILERLRNWRSSLSADMLPLYNVHVQDDRIEHRNEIQEVEKSIAYLEQTIKALD
jgi:hypothetical protein